MFMSRSEMRLTILLALVGICPLSTAAEETQNSPTKAEKEADTSWSKPVNGLSARVVLERHRVTNGTTRIHANLEVWNVAKQTLFIDWHSNCMEYAVLDDQRRKLPQTIPKAYSGCIARKHDLFLRAGERGILEMTVDGVGVAADLAGAIDMGPPYHWTFPTSELDYFFHAVLKISKKNTLEEVAGEPWRGRIKLPAVLIPLKKPPLPDHETTGNLIDALGAQMVCMPYSESNEVAERRLSLIDDERVVPWYRRALETDRSSLKARALDRFGYFKSDLALEGIKLGLQTQGKDIGNCSDIGLANGAADYVRSCAAKALGCSAHPNAKQLWLTMSQHPDFQVRSAVVRALGKANNPQVIKLLPQMHVAPNESLRDAAERFLKILQREGGS